MPPFLMEKKTDDFSPKSCFSIYHIFMRKNQSVSFGTGLGYAVTDGGQNVFLNIISFFLLYYCTDIVGLSPLYAGYGLMIGRIVDAVTDPLMGYLSDRTKSRFGRRKPYMAIGALLLFGSMVALFSLPKGLEEIPTFLLMTLWYCLACIGYTLVNVPYCAMLPEMTKDYDERTKITGGRMAFAIVGTFIAAGATQVLTGSLGWSLAIAILGIPVLITPFITIFSVKENPEIQNVSKSNILKEAWEVLSFKPFLFAYLPWGFFMIGVTFLQISLLYFFKYVYFNEDLFSLALMALLGVSLLFIPVWVIISKKIGKKVCYMIGMSLSVVMTLILSFFGQNFDSSVAILIMALAGIGMSTHYVIPHSILPDVIEYDSVIKGERREGFYAAFWTFISKLGSAAGSSMVGGILFLYGYEANADQTAKAIEGIRMLIGPFPGILIIIGVFILGFYPISKSFYDREVCPKKELDEALA